MKFYREHYILTSEIFNLSEDKSKQLHIEVLEEGKFSLNDVNSDKINIFIFPGLFGNGNEFYNLYERMDKSKYRMFILYPPSHKLTSQSKLFKNFDDYIWSLNGFLDKKLEKVPSSKVIFIGVSFGGIVALYLSLMGFTDELIIENPLLYSSSNYLGYMNKFTSLIISSIYSRINKKSHFPIRIRGKGLSIKEILPFAKFLKSMPNDLNLSLKEISSKKSQNTNVTLFLGKSDSIVDSKYHIENWDVSEFRRHLDESYKEVKKFEIDSDHSLIIYDPLKWLELYLSIVN